MLNKLSESFFFNQLNNKYRFTDSFGKYNLSDYYIPEEFYMDRVKNFKNFHYPLVNEVIKAIEDKHIIPVDFTNANNPNVKVQNFSEISGWPTNIFNMEIIGSDGNPVILFDLSSKGKYTISPTTKVAVYYSIDDTNFFAMCTAAYVYYKLVFKPELTKSSDLFTNVAECYALIMDKVFSPLLSTNSIIDISKIHLLNYSFCLQAMFNIDKHTALEYAKKSKHVFDKNNTVDDSYYCQSDDDIMANLDYSTRFPITNFCNIICKEFDYITENVCNPGKLAYQIDKWFTRNAMFTLEHSMSFITMLIFNKYGLDLFSPYKAKQFLSTYTKDIMKEIALVVK